MKTTHARRRLMRDLKKIQDDPAAGVRQHNGLERINIWS